MKAISVKQQKIIHLENALTFEKKSEKAKECPVQTPPTKLKFPTYKEESEKMDLLAEATKKDGI